MFNVLIDELPEEWNGYPVDMDFRTGILISQCMADEELSDVERFYTVRGLLFPESAPNDIEDVEAAIRWYLTEYNHDNHVKSRGKAKKAEETEVFDFDVDQWRIYAAFRMQYGIDLSTAQMHWFVFMGLLANLNDCTLVRVMNTRGKKITNKMSPETIQALKDAKARFAIKTPKERPRSAEEQAALDEFMKYANINKEPRA